MRRSYLALKLMRPAGILAKVEPGKKFAKPTMPKLTDRGRYHFLMKKRDARRRRLAVVEGRLSLREE